MHIAPRRRHIRRLGAAIALALVGVLLAAGCAGIPRSGEVHAGENITVDGDLELDFLPSSPQKNASTEMILRGFIDAASSPIGEYAIAREFLAPSFASQWKPNVATTIDQGRRQYLSKGEDAMDLTITPIAEVDAQGEYRQVESVASVPLTFSFVQVDGQWRISAAPDGILLDQVTFNEVFSTHPLYFFDPGFKYMVPDLRWFPRRESTPTRIVKALLNGPSEWLVGGVVSAFPDGSKLTADAVQVIARDAKVDLGAEAFAAESPTLQRMKLQLRTSLVSVPSIYSVTLSIDQTVQDIPDLTSSTVLTNPRVDTRPLIFRNGVFGFLPATGEELVPVTGISSQLAVLQPVATTLSASQMTAAVLTGDGVYLVNRGDSPILADGRAGLIAPALDNLGYLWSVPAGQPSELQAFSSESGAMPVSTLWPEASEIVSFAISRDGTRVVALLRSGKDTLLVAAAVLRGENNAPIGLGAPLPLRADEGTALDVTWVDELTVATLSAQGDGTSEVMTHQLGGRNVLRGAVADGLWVSAGNTSRDLRVLDANGHLLTPRGQGWQERVDAVDFVATQQGLPR